MVLIRGKSRKDKWNGVVLTDKNNVFRDSHSLSPYTISKHYELVS